MKKILVAVDFSDITSHVVDEALTLAKSFDAKAWIVHVTSDQLKLAVYEASEGYLMPDGSAEPMIGNIEMARELCAREYRQEHHALLHFSEKFRHAGVEAQAMLLKGNAADLLLEQAENLDVDMIVMGSHGHTLLRKMLLGSVAEAVLRKALCNVLIVPVRVE